MDVPLRPEPVVSVRGEWYGEVPPELARVLVTVAARGRERPLTLKQLNDRVEETRAVIEGYGEAVERVDASPLRVTARYKDQKPTERVTGYVAELQLTVVAVDFGVLGDMLFRLADRDMVSIRGPYWALRADSAVYGMARTEAVRDARTRAEEYAAAAGTRLTGLVEIADGAASSRFTEATAYAMPASARGSVADDVTFDVEPVPQEVSASVEARFTLAPLDFP